MRVTIILIVFFTQTACSYRTAFDAVQAGNRHQCSKLPPSQYDECIGRVSKTYEDYERERKEILN